MAIYKYIAAGIKTEAASQCAKRMCIAHHVNTQLCGFSIITTFRKCLYSQTAQCVQMWRQMFAVTLKEAHGFVNMYMFYLVIFFVKGCVSLVSVMDEASSLVYLKYLLSWLQTV